MDLEQVQLALNIAKHGSLTRAAIALGIEQSVISRQLSAFEKEYGSRLFHRTGRGMTLTDFGTAIMPRLEWLIDAASKIEDEIRDEAGIVAGDVRVGFLPALSSRIICQLVPKLRESHERIRLHFFEGSNGQLEEWLTNGTIDIAILYRYGQVNPTVDRVLGSNCAHLIGKPDSPLLQNETVPFSALDGIPLILPNTPNSLRNTMANAARQHGISLNVVVEADSIVIQKDLVREGLGMAVLGEIAITAEEREGLRSARIVDPEISRSAVLVASSRRPATRALRVALQEIEEIAPPLLQPNPPMASAGGRK